MQQRVGECCSVLFRRRRDEPSTAGWAVPGTFANFMIVRSTIYTLLLLPEHRQRFPTSLRLYPLEQSRNGGGQVALGDGGYADNEGIVTAVDWVDFISLQASKNMNVPFKRILLLRIQPASDADSLQTKDKRLSLRSRLRWLTGPIESLVTMRTSSQLERGQLESDLAASYLTTPWWKHDTTGEIPVNAAPSKAAGVSPLRMKSYLRETIAQQSILQSKLTNDVVADDVFGSLPDVMGRCFRKC